MFFVARNIMPSFFALGTAIVWMLGMTPSFKVLISFFTLVNLLMIYQYLKNFNQKWLFGCGFAAGLTIYFRQEIGGYAILTTILCVVLHHLFLTHSESESMSLLSRIKSTFLRISSDISKYLLILTISLFPLFLFYFLKKALPSFIHGISMQTIKASSLASKPFPSPFLLSNKKQITVSTIEIFILYFSILLLITVAMILIFRLIKKIHVNDNWLLFTTLTLSNFCFFHVWHWPHLFRLPTRGSLIFLIGGYVAFRSYSHFKAFFEHRVGSRAIQPLIKIILIIIILTPPILFLTYYLTNRSIYKLGIPLLNKTEYSLIEAKKGRVYHLKYWAEEINETINYITNHSLPNETIFCFHQNYFYFLSERKNATGFDQVWVPIIDPASQEQLLLELEKNRPKFIVITHFDCRRYLDSLQPVFDYIVKNYRFDRNFEDFYFLFEREKNNTPDFSIGIFYYLAGKWKKAIYHYKKALSIEPQNYAIKKALLEWSIKKPRHFFRYFEGYIIWPEGNIWHIRWGSPMKNRFQGVIISDQPFRYVKDYKLEDKDVFNYSDYKIIFDARSAYDEDGIDFETPANSKVSFDIQMNNEKDSSKIVKVE
ncbi:MAG: hypothetical protein JSV96_14845 [Candidatus Aminicenantes bacterium]|nr:MAG: hypothetical protein JSV96_14845 [Candidatus Aminicenantes bacterium]